MTPDAPAENASRNRQLYTWAIVVEVLFVAMLWLLGRTFG